MRPFVLVSALVTFIASSGCADFWDDLRTEEVAVAVLLSTPGAVDPATQQVVLPATTLTVYFGQVDVLASGGAIAKDAYTPRPDAEVVLSFKDPYAGLRELAVPPAEDGSFVLDSRWDPRLVYVATEYTVWIRLEGEVYQMKVRALGESDIAEVEAMDGVIEGHRAGAPLTLTRADAKGDAGNDVAFVNLLSLDDLELPLWSNVPADSFAYLDLVYGDDPWRADSFEIPGRYFAPGGVYLVTLARIARGEKVQGNGFGELFIGSGFFAGSATGGAVVVP